MFIGKGYTTRNKFDNLLSYSGLNIHPDIVDTKPRVRPSIGHVQQLPSSEKPSLRFEAMLRCDNPRVSFREVHRSPLRSSSVPVLELVKTTPTEEETGVLENGSPLAS
ncbi:hypothetical protein DPMN_149220 [Dreissena polymorpha]|uniref:Uncharacterized protein n=1 Tax=Dreissena polymorpha TaxID=45954 RepID=A0A9D4J4I4_DREPO|nr:hypothetical protein DPMN_149220 [Dreissena polymorpha]